MALMKRTVAGKMIIAGLVACLVGAYFFLDLGRYLSLSYIKESKAGFEMLYESRPAAVIASYMIIYILVTSLSLPGAAVLTLAGGALFGLWAGTLIVSFASSIGATFACIVSRYLLREWVQSRFGKRLRTVNEGIEKEGAFYLFTLRLIPVIPFWLINLAMGLTAMPIRTFYWVSQAGMLAGTVIYVNAGKELAAIESVSGILSGRVILSFALLGLFPLAARKMLDIYRSARGSRS